ncbi:di-N-acetylchitobiase-like [Ptychodera flava]|uniref:di-N-acetylchitobiase-like n=1 Tax=Ptychodera flava TaxID=63121 RepID=UPI00396AA23C
MFRVDIAHRLIALSSILCCSLAVLFPDPPSTCPCADPKLCEPITRKPEREVYAFSVSPKTWKHYDWSKLTTVVMFGYYDAELMCFAHSQNVKVVFKGYISVANLTDSYARNLWVVEQLQTAVDGHFDGINIDIEDPVVDKSVEKELLTELVEQTSEAFHIMNKFSQVTFDVAWSPDCIDKRCYDYKGLADATDFLFVMSYDEQSQIYGPCVAMANSPYNKTVTGVEKYLKLGIPANKLVLGVPWYGYDYPCVNITKDNLCTIKKVPFRGAPCSDAAGRQKDYRVINEIIKNSTTGRLWNDEYKAPYFNFEDPTTKQTHQMWYDDPESLKYRYDYASKTGLLGVGMWEADSLDYSDDETAKKQTKAMWDAL